MQAQVAAVMTTVDCKQLWLQFKKTHDINIRNELVMKYLFIPKRIVGRMATGVGNYLSMDDLMSYGIIGLIDAIEKFDITRETKFETYAYLRVKGEIIDYARRQDWAPTGVRQKLKLIEDAYYELGLRAEGRVTEEEVARSLNMDITDLQKTLENSYMFNLVYIDEMLEAKNEISHSSSIEDICEESELKSQLAVHIDKLNTNEKLVVNLYYVEEMTLKEIGLTLGLSESRISQIHSKVLLKLKNYFKSSGN